MSDPFALQRRIHTVLLKGRPTVTDGMAIVLDAIKEAQRAKAWSALDGFDWGLAESGFEKWLKGLVKKQPPPAPVRAVWVEVPDVIFNVARTSVLVFPSYDPADERLGLEMGHEWPSSVEEGMCEWEVVEAAIEMLKWRQLGPDSSRGEGMEPGMHAMVHAITTLVAMNVLPRLAWMKSITEQAEVLVAVSWFDAEPDPIGMLGPKGWNAFKRTKAK